MRRYGLLPACFGAIVMAALLSGCATNTLGQALNNPACVVKVSGNANFGSVTPTGSVKFAATCKPGTQVGPDAVRPSDVANPPPTQG